LTEETQDTITVNAQELRELHQEHAQSVAMNQRLEYLLQQAKVKLAEMKDELERLSNPPNVYASFLHMNDDGSAEVIANGRRMRCTISNHIPIDELHRGRYLIMNEQMVAIAIGPYADAGEICKVLEVLDDRRLVIEGRLDERKIIYLRDGLKVEERPLKPGDEVLVDPTSAVAMEYVYKVDEKDTLLESVPDVTYDKIGGIDDAIEIVHHSVELPYKHPDVFKEFELNAPKGILLYGPPGCGKTLIAKAIANSLAKKGGVSQFINISGPQLLTKWVGESERRIREVFNKAREAATPESPVVIFFDEAESLFRMRGSGKSSDMESTIVPTLLAQLDGVEGLENVLVIFASNRQDLIDPAVLRPGRIDVKIRLSRPDRDASKKILSVYLHSGLPIEGDLDSILDKTIDYLFEEAPNKEFLELVYNKGTRETLYFKDFLSGAMLENIVARAKKLAVLRRIEGETTGITTEDMITAVDQEFHATRDLPNTSDVSDWQAITGRNNGEEIVKIRSLIQKKEAEEKKPKKVEDAATGQYL